MVTLLEYLKQKEQRKIINEAFSSQDFSKAITLITSYLEKKISHIKLLPGVENFESNGNKLYGYRWLCLNDGSSVRIGWSNDARGAANAYCVDFFSDAKELFDGKGKTELSVYCNGASVALILPLIVEVLSTGTYNADSTLVKKLVSARVHESHKIGRLNYRMVKEDSALAVELMKKKKSLQSKKSVNKSMGLDITEIDMDIARINDALSSGSDVVMEDTLLTFKRNVSTVTQLPAGYARAQQTIDQKKEEHFSDPKLAFKMLEKYLVLAIKGDRNIVLICGAPGVGKTFRVKKFLNSLTNPRTGHRYIWADDVDGVNGDIFLIKGKGTGAELYKMLYRSREEGKILMIDDADSILDDDMACNLLKAAGEGGKDRVVTYAVAKKIMDKDPLNPDGEIEIPKAFKHNGKIIILTNKRAGMVDTAVRSRAYIQDINFTVQSVLEIIRDVMPTIKDANITEEGKQKAFDYLTQLAEDGSDMEISLRTFGTCAGIFSVISGSEEEEELAMHMIKENMRLQSDRGGSKY